MRCRSYIPEKQITRDAADGFRSAKFMAWKAPQEAP